jgi:quinol monooxygenase YgiN
MMIFIKIEIKSNPLKSQELFQTLNELQPFIKKKTGCRDVSISEQTPDKDLIIYNEKWVTGEQLIRHITSDQFVVLTGAIRVLAKTSVMAVSTKSHMAYYDLKSSDTLKEISLRISNFVSETD